MDAAIQEMEPPFDPACFDDVTRDFITQLLCKDPTRRLGANGGDKVMSHPYFSDMNWEEIIHDAIEPPAIPRKDLNVATQHEIGSFMDSSKAKVELTASDAELFTSWDFVRQSSFLEEIVEFMRFEEEKVITDLFNCVTVSEVEGRLCVCACLFVVILMFEINVCLTQGPIKVQNQTNSCCAVS